MAKRVTGVEIAISIFNLGFGSGRYSYVLMLGNHSLRGPASATNSWPTEEAARHAAERDILISIKSSWRHPTQAEIEEVIEIQARSS